MTKQYAYKGSDDSQSICNECGKTGLKKVIWLAQLDLDGSETDNIFSVGTTCGARMLGYSQKDFRKAIGNAEETERKVRLEALKHHPLRLKAEKIFTSIDHLRGMVRLNHPKMKEYNQLTIQAQAEIDRQSFSVPMRKF